MSSIPDRAGLGQDRREEVTKRFRADDVEFEVRGIALPKKPNVTDPVFGPVYPFDAAHVSKLAGGGVYIIYDLAGPIYVGRSINDIRGRLRRHLSGQGNRIVRQAAGSEAVGSLMFEFRNLTSVHQVEKQLISHLGTQLFANLIDGTDPAEQHGSGSTPRR